MKATRRMVGIACIAVFGLVSITGSQLFAQTPAQTPPAGGAPAQGAAAPKYTMAEYNAYQAAAAEKNPAAQLKLLDDFMSKYPNSALLNYIYVLYFSNYGGQKNFPKAIEYCDKLLALGDKASPTERYQAYSVRAFAYNNIQNPDGATAKAAYDAAIAGIDAVSKVPKPEGVDDAKFEQQRKESITFFTGTAANAAMPLP